MVMVLLGCAIDVKDHDMESREDRAVSLLRDSLSDALDTVRAYDTKAQIVGVGYIFALGVVGTITQSLGLTANDEPNIFSILIPWIFIILPILLFGHVLYPTRKSNQIVKTDDERSGAHIMFFEPSPTQTVDDLKKAVIACDPVDELAFELLKTSRLREIKRSRFLRALFSAGIAFATLFLSQLYLLFFQS